MQYETKKRSLLKAFSWRTCATLTTAIIVFVFTGEFVLAVAVGFIEVFAKMALYFVHERLWQKISFGRKEVPSFVLWFTGLPASGKKSIADRVYNKLVKEKLKVERLDSRDVRPLFPETGFTPIEVDRHVKRAGHLCAMLEKNGVIVVASFVSPYRESRAFAKNVSKHFIEVYLDTTPEACAKRDTKGHYAKAQRGEFKNFPGVDVDYQIPHDPALSLNIDVLSHDQAVDQIIKYLKQYVLSGCSKL